MPKSKGFMALCALCVVAALCCAFFAGTMLGRSRRIDVPAVVVAPTATPGPEHEDAVQKVEASLYAEGNVPYAYDLEKDTPSLPSEAAIDAVIEAHLAMDRVAYGDKYDEEKLRARYRSAIDTGGETYEPTIKGYLVEGSRSAVVIYPGGGYHSLSSKIEGSAVAHAFNAKGISAFVVKYRIAPCDYRAILSDGRRAIRYVRAHAGEYGIDPDRIAACGFSQGGHLALMTCQHPEFEIDDAAYRPDGADEVSGLPNACIVCYGVATLEKGHTYEVGAEIFTHGDDGLRALYSAENGVTDDMCPTFIWLNADDLLVPVEGAYRLADALKARGVPYAFHVFESGGHGCGLGEDLPCGAWLSMACVWLDRVM